jgi:hypothetical protein
MRSHCVRPDRATTQLALPIAFALAVLLGLLLGDAGSARALDLPGSEIRVAALPVAAVSLESAPLLSANAVLAAVEIDVPLAALAEARSRYRRLLDGLRSIPLRPVTIGEAPRRPNDPEPGVGVVLRLTF